MLKQTVKALQRRRNQIASQITSLQAESARIAAALQALSGKAEKTGGRKRRRMSASARARIAAAQRARWAKYRAGKK